LPVRRRFKWGGISQLAWAVRKDNVELREAVNSIIRQWKANGKLDAVIKKWIPD